MAYGVFEELTRLDGPGLTRLNDMLRYLHDALQTHMTVDSAGVALRPPAMSVTVDDDASRVLDFDAGGQKAALSALWVDELVVTGRVTAGADRRLPACSGQSVLTVGPGRVPDGVSVFTTFASAMESLGRVLPPGTTVVNVDAGTYNEGLNIQGFTGEGTLQVNLAGGDSAGRAVFTGPSVIAQNRTTVMVLANTIQNDCAWKPALRSDTGIALLVRNNGGTIVLGGVLCRGGGPANTVEVRNSAMVALSYCTIDGTAADRLALYLVYCNVSLANARGTNAGVALRLGEGGHIIRRGTTLNGTTLVSNIAGGMHDAGTITATNSADAGTLGQTLTTQTFPASATLTWRADAGQYRADSARLLQGTADGAAQIGCLFFAGAAVLAGRTLVSARLYLARRRGVGDAQPVALRLWALGGPTAAPLAGANGTTPMTAIGGVNGLSLGSLPWDDGRWFDLPAALAARAMAGGGLALQGDAACFDGVGGDDPPRLALTVA